ncbi:MAG: hypothetical protein H7X80_05165 [bacterium]|nr:hypothetical protein [Candidatus Kapabacteria bacterium]
MNTFAHIILICMIGCASQNLIAQDASDVSPVIDSLHRATMSRASDATRAFILDQARNVPTDYRGGTWSSFNDAYNKSIRGGTVDPNALLQLVLRESYRQATEDLKFFASKMAYFNAAKKQVREYAAGLRAMNEKHKAASASEPCRTPQCVSSAEEIAALLSAVRRTGLSISVTSKLATFGDARALVSELDGHVKRLENDEAKAEASARATRAHRTQMLAALRDYMEKVSQIKGAY